MLIIVGIHFPSLGSKIRRPTSYDMSSGMQWMALTCRATFSGPNGQRIIPFGVLMHGKEIGVQLDKCGFIAPVGIEHFFDAFCFEPQRPWRAAAAQALGVPSSRIEDDMHIMLADENKFTLTPRRIPAERRATTEKSRSDVVMDAGEESGSGAESGWSYLTTPLLAQTAPSWRPRRWPLTKTGLIQPMRLSEICQQACMK